MSKLGQKTRKIMAFIFAFVMIFSICSVTNEKNAKAEVENKKIEDAKDAILQIKLVYTDPTSSKKYTLTTGTGFLVATEDESNGSTYVITAAHVITLDADITEEAKSYFGIADNQKLDTSIEVVIKGSNTVGASVYTQGDANSGQDFAILQLSQPIKRRTLKINTTEATPTSDVYALGFPYVQTTVGKDFPTYTPKDVSVNKGSISLNGEKNGYKTIVHNAALDEGVSGGPTLDKNGNVIGINTGYYTDESGNRSNTNESLSILEVAEVMDTYNIKYVKADKGSTSDDKGDEDTDDEKDNKGDSKSAYESALEAAKNISTDDYTAKSIDKLKSVVAGAESDVAADESDEIYAKAAENINNAIDQLEEKDAADKSELNKTIKDAEGKDKSKYSKSSYGKLKDALDEAKSIAENDDASQEEIDSAVIALNNAIDGLKESSSINWILIGIIAAASLVVIIIIILIIVLTKKPKKSTPSFQQTSAPRTPVSPAMGSTPAPRPTPVRPSVPQAPVAPVPPSRGNIMSTSLYDAGDAPTSLLNDGAGETTLLSNSNQPLATLIKTRTNEKINIGKSTFKIGKERNKVDYCITNNSVSRVHAIITFENGAYYIQDNHSTNFTFVDGKQLKASEKVKLENNARLKFADEEYQFKLL